MHVLAARGHCVRLVRCVATCIVQIGRAAHPALGWCGACRCWKRPKPKNKTSASESRKRCRIVFAE
eukprot:7598321-Alexandrium_andersonii.AAC.1